MRNPDKALADIFAIRNQIAAGTAFRGYGPETVAATGGLALFTAITQFLWLGDPTGHPLAFFTRWAAAALGAGALVWVEIRDRFRRHSSGVAGAMGASDVAQILPAGRGCAAR